MIVGTLYKHMKLKPCILDEYSKEVELLVNNYVASIFSICTMIKYLVFSPSFLNKQRSVTPLVQPHNFVHSDDYLILEDESGRVNLSGTSLSPSFYVTG